MGPLAVEEGPGTRAFGQLDVMQIKIRSRNGRGRWEIGLT